MPVKLVAENAISGWLASLEQADATNNATNRKDGGAWVELVKVKKWYSMRLMRWDATNKRKKYVKYLGTLDDCKKDPIYGAEALRHEKRRFAVSGGKISLDTGAFEQNAGLLH